MEAEQLYLEMRALASSHRYGEIVEKCTPLAEQGDPVAQYFLAECYRAAADEKLEYFRNEIPSGSPNMQRKHELFPRTPFAEVVDEERRLAFEWYKKSAEQGYPAALYELSGCYVRGEGTAPYPPKAQELLGRAAEGGYAAAEYDLAMQFYFGVQDNQRRTVVAQSYETAILWLRRAAEQNYPLAQYYLGLCHEEGNGVEQNGKEALRLYRMAAEAELAWAICAVGRCYEYGKGTAVDLKEARAWYERAAAFGDAEAIEALARMEDD